MEEHKDNRLSVDRLAWWEEAPLALALLAQSYVVGLWYYVSIEGATWQLDLVVAVGAGLALDLIVVTTVMGRRAGRSSGWSWATSLGAFFCSALIALDRYGWEWRSGLHVAFPLVVFLYSQHLATPKRSQAVPVAPASNGYTEAASHPIAPQVTPQPPPQIPASPDYALLVDDLAELEDEPQGESLEELKERARRMRAANPRASWAAIGLAVGRSPATVRGWLEKERGAS